MAIRLTWTPICTTRAALLARSRHTHRLGAADQIIPVECGTLYHRESWGRSCGAEQLGMRPLGKSPTSLCASPWTSCVGCPGAGTGRQRPSLVSHCSHITKFIPIAGILCSMKGGPLWPAYGSPIYSPAHGVPDFTSVTSTSFSSWSAPEAAFQGIWRRGASMGNLRTARRFTVYELPLRTGRSAVLPAHLPEDLCAQVAGAPVRHTRAANQWIHVLLPVLLAALRTLGDAPARSLTALAQRLGVTEADAATMVTPLAEEPPPVVAVPAVAPASPLLPTTGRNGVSSAPKTLRNRPRVRAARKRTTP
jgi:hypothetical protein